MLVNERGLLVCLLNRWHEEVQDPVVPPMSRGQLVMEMGGLDYVPAVEESLRSAELAGMKPFTMVAFDAVGERGWNWNGRELSVSKLEMPVCSSSYHFEEVEAARRSRYRELSCARQAHRNLLEDYHSDTDGGASAFTVRMCRPDAQTMSRSRVRVDASGVRWWYWEEEREFAGEPRLFETAL